MMNRLVFFSNYAFKRLQNGGQRVFIALLAVAFGVMSLIAMVAVSESIKNTLSHPPRIALGGDLMLLQPESNFSAIDLATLAQAQVDGLISAYSPITTHYSLLIRTLDSGRARFVERGIGINPNVYPLAGELVISAPQGASLADVLGDIGTTVITRDLVAQYDLAIGDVLRVAQSDGVPLTTPLTVTGILDSTPTQLGQSLYYSLETAHALYGADMGYDSVLANTSDPSAAAESFGASGLGVIRADQQIPEENTIAALFDLLLRGAGVMGLIVGGIGIANTMQVLVAQRRHEVGILKTLGCSQRDMLYISLLEVGVLSVFGSLLGAIAAQGVAAQIITLFANSSSLLMAWTFNLGLTVGGIGIGIITTLIFAFYAIYRTSRIRPTVIFRQEDTVQSGWGERLKPFGFYAILLIPFGILTSLIMGSLQDGIGVIAVALGGLTVFSALLGVTSWGMLRVMPTFGQPLFKMARNNLRKRATSFLFAMIALFIGIFTLGFATTVLQVSFGEFFKRQLTDSANLSILVEKETAPQVEAMLTRYGATDITTQAPPDTMGYIRPDLALYASVNPAQEVEIARIIGEAFPDSMTLTRTDISAEMNRTFNNLFGLAMAMAGLALLAGVMLVANVVSLALIERRYEIGVMKAVGYTRRHILTLLGLEYGLVGFIASVMGILGVQAAIIFITVIEGAAIGLLILHPLMALSILAIGMLLTLVTALTSAWKPAGVRPLHILNQGL